MIRLSDAVFISSEPDCDSVIAIRIKNGEYYFLGWMEDAENYNYVMAKHPEENHICQLRLIIHMLTFSQILNVMRETENRMLRIMTSSLLQWMKSILLAMH